MTMVDIVGLKRHYEMASGTVKALDGIDLQIMDQLFRAQCIIQEDLQKELILMMMLHIQQLGTKETLGLIGEFFGITGEQKEDLLVAHYMMKILDF